MSRSLIDLAPRGALRWLLRLPIHLYRARLGWLLGERFLMLTHQGRKSGLPRQTVIEVVQHDRKTDTYYVVSGWGSKADWYQNVEKNPNVLVHAGRRTLKATAEPVPLERAIGILRAYARLHPIAFREIGRLFFGSSVSLEPEAVERLAGRMPMVALHARDQ
ncbi:MAG: nitroreductase family deazaflavin-dependent oxidoreductase [Bacteroidota bacterium]